MIDNIKRGEIVLVDLSGAQFNEQGYSRPAIIIQNDIGNRYSPTTIIVPLTSKVKNDLVTHVEIRGNRRTGLKETSTALCEQVRTVDKRRIIKKIGKIDNMILSKIYDAYKASFGEL